MDLILTNPPHRSNQPVTSSDNSHSSTSLLNGATSNSSSTGPVLQDTAVLGSGDGTRKNGIDVDDDDESPVAKKKRFVLKPLTLRENSQYTKKHNQILISLEFRINC